MLYLKKISYLIWLFPLLQSCVVTNQLYFNNGHPSGKGNIQGYAGIGTGLTPKVDSIGEIDGTIYLNDQIKPAPILAVGVQAGIGKKTDIRAAIHTPYVLAGFGLRLGVQHSLFDSASKFNMAAGMDLGVVFSRDSISIFGSKNSIEKSAEYALNADFFIPISYRFKNGMHLILTPRYNFTGFEVRYKKPNPDDTYTFNVSFPVMSLGVRTRKIYAEVSALKYGQHIVPQLGLAYGF